MTAMNVLLFWIRPLSFGKAARISTPCWFTFTSPFMPALSPAMLIYYRCPINIINKHKKNFSLIIYDNPNASSDTKPISDAGIVEFCLTCASPRNTLGTNLTMESEI